MYSSKINGLPRVLHGQGKVPAFVLKFKHSMLEVSESHFDTTGRQKEEPVENCQL